MCPTALAQQIPYFEQHNPEGLCIATYMNASTNVGVLMVVAYFTFMKCIRPVPHSIAVPFILISSPFAAYLASSVYGVTYHGISIFLFLCCSIGGYAGSLSSVIMNPYLTKYENDLISASRSGGSFCIVLSAVLAAIQSPGSTNPRFGTSTYMLIIGILLSLPIFAYGYITHNNIGLRAEMSGSGSGREDEDGIDCHTDFACMENRSIKNLLHSGGVESVTAAHVKYNNISGSDHLDNQEYENNRSERINHELNFTDDDGIHDIIIPITIRERNERNERNERGIHSNNDGLQTSMVDRIIRFIVPFTILKSNPWIIKVIPLCAVIGFVNMNTWGMVTALAPFAFENVSTVGTGPRYLGAAYEFGAVCLMLGDLSTTITHFPVKYAIVMFTLFTSIVYISALNLFQIRSPLASSLVVLCFAVGRFFEAHLVTSTYRKIASDFHPSDRENAARAAGVADQMSTTAGSIITSFLVAKYASC